MSDVRELEASLGYRFRAPALLGLALTRASAASAKPGADEARGNERLEFLGDAVLSAAVAHLLFQRHPEWQEGELSRARAALVSNEALARKARELKLQQYIVFGPTESANENTPSEKAMANVYEALLGAMYLDAGLTPVIAFVERSFGAALALQGEAGAGRDAKTKFQEWAHAQHGETPRYASEDSGVANSTRRFSTRVTIAGETWGEGVARNKKLAEQAAARAALERTAAQS